jgi:hypothetical protein
VRGIDDSLRTRPTIGGSTRTGSAIMAGLGAVPTVGRPSDTARARPPV